MIPENFGYIAEIYYKTKSQKRISGINRFNSLNKELFFKRYAQNGIPVIYKTINGLKQATIEQIYNILINNFESKEIEVRPHIYSDPEDYSIRRLTCKMNLLSFINKMKNSLSEKFSYAANNKLLDEELKIIGVHKPNFYNSDYFQPAKFWIGPKGVATPLHADGLDNFVIQIAGRKRWKIFPVRDYPFLYMFVPKPETLPNFHASKIDFRNVDLIKYPDIKKAKGIEFIVNAGETLYLPAGWIHYVETIEDSFMINFWNARNIRPGILNDNCGI